MPWAARSKKLESECTEDWSLSQAVNQSFSARRPRANPQLLLPPSRCGPAPTACRCALRLARGARYYLRAHLPLLAAASFSSPVFPELLEARGSQNASRRWGCSRGMGAAGPIWVFLTLLAPGVLGELGMGSWR